MLKHEHRTPAGRILFVGIFKVEILSVEKFRNYLDADCSLQVSKPSFNLRKKQTKFYLPESSSSGPGASKNVLNSLSETFRMKFWVGKAAKRAFITRFILSFGINLIGKL